MKIDPSLQLLMDPHIATVRATIGNSDQEYQLVRAILYTMVGMGLATSIREHWGITWIPTAKLKRRIDCTAVPMDYFSAVGAANDRRYGLRSMARSLQLIIGDMIEVEEDAITKGAKDIDVDLVLGSLAHRGNALLGERPTGELIWVASPELINRYVMGMEWRPLQPHGRPPLIRLDDVLAREIERLWNVSWTYFGAAEHRRSFTCSWLLKLERRGDAIAYKNKTGQLAWKASPELVKMSSRKPLRVVSTDSTPHSE
jgi:hypothetical protein